MLGERLRRHAGRYIRPAVPAHLAARQRALGPAARAELVESLEGNFFRDDTSFLDAPAGRRDLHAHLDGRIGEFRAHVVVGLRTAARRSAGPGDRLRDGELHRRPGRAAPSSPWPSREPW